MTHSEAVTRTNAEQAVLRHLDIGSFAEPPFDKGLRMADHILTFLACDEEGMFPVLSGICDEIM